MIRHDKEQAPRTSLMSSLLLSELCPCLLFYMLSSLLSDIMSLSVVWYAVLSVDVWCTALVCCLIYWPLYYCLVFCPCLSFDMMSSHMLSSVLPLSVVCCLIFCPSPLLSIVWYTVLLLVVCYLKYFSSPSMPYLWLCFLLSPSFYAQLLWCLFKTPVHVTSPDLSCDSAK